MTDDTLFILGLAAVILGTVTTVLGFASWVAIFAGVCL